MQAIEPEPGKAARHLPTVDGIRQAHPRPSTQSDRATPAPANSWAAHPPLCLYSVEEAPWRPRDLFLVWQTDNDSRVRDGYTRLSTSGQARASATQQTA